jgi:exocyst complex protein 7
METTYQQLVNDQRNQYLQCWNRVLHNCMESSMAGIAVGGPSTGGKVKDKDRQMIKDRFTGFNKELDELARIQRYFAVPDSKLRDKLRKGGFHSQAVYLRY